MSPHDLREPLCLTAQRTCRLKPRPSNLSSVMKRTYRQAAIGSFVLAISLCVHAEDPQPHGTSTKAASPTPTPSLPSLRKPGFVFMEFGTTHVEEYFAYFESVAEFKLASRQPGYLVAQSERAELSFIDPKFWAHGHPFSGKLTGKDQGVGIEIGIVVADLDKTYAAALQWKDKGWPISTGIVRRPWGVRDFRVLAPDGYYLRFTEGR
jgi:hypothetical protein